MPSSQRRKKSKFLSDPVKCVFLFGEPTKRKRKIIQQMEQVYVEMINSDIKSLMQTPGINVHLIKNAKRDSNIRQLQKKMRMKSVNAAFCQIAFDSAFTKLSSYLNAIRIEMCTQTKSVFCQSKVLFGLFLDGASRDEMLQWLHDMLSKPYNQNADFYRVCEANIQALSDTELSMQMMELHDLYQMVSAQLKVPYVKSEAILLDSRLMKIEASTNIAMPYVITLTNPFERGKRISVPINTSRHSLHKIRAYDMASSITLQMRGSKLKVEWSYSKHLKKPETKEKIGVDVGIKDCFYLSNGHSIGSMKKIIDYYYDTVVPSFAQLSYLRSKKKKISYFVRHHKNLSKDVRRSLIQKMDRLEHMIRAADTPYRKKRTYYSMLNHEINQDVKAYISNLSHDTLTVLELLDIKTFTKSRRLNGSISMFARGKLQKKLMSELNWYGYDYVEVPPDFTSQTCPVCGCLDSENRSKVNGKIFKCVCCGYEDDADHVGALNIKTRIDDQELLNISANTRAHKEMQTKMINLLNKKHLSWLKAHNC